jgi:hypothetical protein
VAQPQVGAKRLSFTSSSADGVWYPLNLIRGSLGDRAFLGHLGLETSASGVPYKPLFELLELDPFDLENDATTTVRGTFAQLARETEITLEFTPSAFVDTLSSDASLPQEDLGTPVTVGIEVFTGGYEYVDTPSIDLMVLEADPGASRVETGAMKIAAPPLEGGVVVRASYSSFVNLAPEDAPPIYAWTGIYRQDRVSVLADGPYRPVIGPVRSLTIAGESAATAHTGVGVTPLIAWDAPGLGKPTLYTLFVFALDDQGSYAEIASVSLPDEVTAFRLTPGLLAQGGRYFVVVSAHSSGIDRNAHGFAVLFRPHLPLAGAGHVSAVFTP